MASTYRRIKDALPGLAVFELCDLAMEINEELVKRETEFYETVVEGEISDSEREYYGED